MCTWRILLSLALTAAAAGFPAVEGADDSGGKAGAKSVVSDLWPARAPGETVELGEERDMTKPAENLVAERSLIRLGNVSKPTISVHRAPAGKSTGTTVLVLPGGGYHILALDLEGTEVCDWLNSIGVDAVLLKYRVPRRPGLEKHAAPLQDAQRAMGLIRSRSAGWGIESRRVGVIGFSAGGHLAAALASSGGGRTYPKVDGADEAVSRPDFSILIYPGYLVREDAKDRLAPEVAVTADHPPTIQIMAQDDGLGVENVTTYFLALKAAKVPSALHIYPSGGHGYGLRRTAQEVTTWPARVEDWLRGNGWVAATR